MSSVRLLLIDIINSNVYRIFRDEYFPFTMGLVRQAGAEALRLFLGCSKEHHDAGPAGLVFDLQEQGTTLLVQRIAEFGPTHVLLNERVTEESLGLIRRAAPRASVRLVETTQSKCLEEWFLEWLRLDWPGPATSATPVEEWVKPDYDGEPANELACGIRPHLNLLLGPLCAYRRALAGNPYFAGLDLSRVENPLGCSFCGTGKNLTAPHVLTDPILAARSQLGQAYLTADRRVYDWEFRIRGNVILKELGAFTKLLEALGAPNSRFHLSLRADEFVAAEEGLRHALPRLEELGHKIIIWNMGVENFSAVENERLNKGVSTETLRRCVGLINEFAERWPAAFSFSEFGFILFTPWTTLEDLKINVQALSDLGLQKLDPFLGSTLLLLPNRAITLLAEKDGLLVERQQHYSFNPACLATWDAQMLPWRFADPRVATIHQIVQRLAPSQKEVAVDLFAERLAAWREEHFPGSKEVAPILEVLVLAAEKTQSSDADALLTAAGRLLARRRKAERGPEGTTMGHLAADLAKALGARPKPPLHPDGRWRVLEVAVRPTESGEAVVVHLAFGNEVVRTALEPLGRRPQYFMRGRRLGLWYQEPNGPLSPGSQTAMMRLLVLAESLLRGARG